MRPDPSEAAGPEERRTGLSSRLFLPCDIASLVFFRVAFGGLMVWEVFRYFGGNRIQRYYVEPKFLFSYYGFEWVKPWPEPWMSLHFIGLGVLALFVAAGMFYRVSAALFAVGFTYVFLLDQSRYLNHFHLVILFAGLLVMVPAHRACSLDVRWGLTRESRTAPAWCLWLLRAQIGIVYLYGGIAKLNPDWLRGEPVRGWLEKHAGTPLFGPLLSAEGTAWVVAYGGLLLDLLAIPALLWRPTRPWAFLLTTLFHLANSVLFRIGIFPWLGIAATTLFLDPGWPRRWLPARLRQPPDVRDSPRPSPAARRIVLTLLGLHASFQLLVPLRHWLYPGDVNWTEEGHRFSWRMKLRDKDGDCEFHVTSRPEGVTRVVRPADLLDPAQAREMSTRPDMILQFAHHLARLARLEGAETAEVRVHARASLNGRPRHPLIDPGVDLAAQPRSLGHAKWILELPR